MPQSDPALHGFHPVVQQWFAQRLGEPSAPQRAAWPLIGSGKSVLIAAPTGSGKTLSAFLACLDSLFRRALDGTLSDETHVLYVSPLKALGNDVQKNLIQPLEEISALARTLGLEPKPIRVLVRTGDTSASERASMLKKPPHILITTPESFYLCLTAQRSRANLRSVRTVVVDEIHALARDKRGSHFCLSMERLKALTPEPPQLVGLSATQKPMDRIAAFLMGGTQVPCERVEIGHLRPWDIRIETPDQELSAVADHEAWGQIYDRLVALTQEHRTTLIFANTRRLAERVAHDLGERLGQDKVAAHHGSMARGLRLDAEERLKAGKLRVMVATASLELGIDIGTVDLVCQLGTPRAIAVALQRIGRAGHYKGGTSKGVLFAMTRDELVECTALLRSIHEGHLDAVRMPEKPLDVLAQQLVAACANEDWDEDALYALCTRSYPYRDLARAEFDAVVRMLAEGVATSRGRSRVHLHHDRVHRKLRGRKGSRITALTNAGAIPDTFSYAVVAEPDEKVVGTLDEDFAVESMAGDVFLLGSTAWRINRVSAGTVRVQSAAGQAPTVPFWLGEAPARTDELSFQVSDLREELVQRDEPLAFLEQKLALPPSVGDALIKYLRSSAAMLGAMPSQDLVVAERFFDEAGGMQLILHAPFGGRINRAWGMALRKRFCRSFDFELQAAANDDAIILSLGEQHSFPLEEIFDFLNENTVEEILVQAVLQAPLFGTRFRWNATRALALTRFSMGKKVPPQIQRARAEDLLAAVFPAQVGCQDNHGGGDIALPDHPLVHETMKDCLREAMDVDGLKRVIRGLRSGTIGRRAVDLPEPSPLAHHILNSQPYTYLDDAPLEERRARAVSIRRTLPPEDAAAFGALDAQAIAQVVAEAAPALRDPEEVHDALLQLVVMPESWLELWEPAPDALDSLLKTGRAARLDTGMWVAAERVRSAEALFPSAVLAPALPPLPGDAPVERDAALLQTIRGWMDVCGPTTPAELGAQLSLPVSDVEQALFRLESEGQVLRGTFRGPNEWCDRRLLQRIHRLTVGRLRREIEPISAQDYMRFLFRWHHMEPQDGLRGPGGLRKAVSLLQGYEAPAAGWELFLLPSRMKQYLPDLLERSAFSGDVAWGRLTLRETRPPLPGPRRGAVVELSEVRSVRQRQMPGRTASLTFCLREDLDWLLACARPQVEPGVVLPEDLSVHAREVAEAMKLRGASFFTELVRLTRRLPAEVEDALWELLARGLVTADAVDNLRVLQSPKRRKYQRAQQRGGPGRWSLLVHAQVYSPTELHEKTAKLFLQRYGIVWRDVALREGLAPSWRELLTVYRKLEARGEIRGGRFVSGFAGEQFALPEAVDMARAVRRSPAIGQVIHVAAIDPLNLTGVVTPGPRIPSTLGNVVTYVDGVPQTGEVAPAKRNAMEAELN